MKYIFSLFSVVSILFIAPFSFSGEIRLVNGLGQNLVLKTSETFREPENECLSGNCGPNELKRVDEQLNQVYETLHTKLPANSASTLKTEQLNWIHHRDRECSLEYGGGDMEKWLGHVLSDSKKTHCVLRVNLERVSQLNKQLLSNDGIKLDVEDELFHGKPKSHWVREYWRWLREFSNGHSPSDDLKGRKCAVRQQGDVWFLTGSTSSGRVNRSCRIPANKALVLPAVNIIGDQQPNSTAVNCEKAIIEPAQAMIDSTGSVKLTVNGVNYGIDALQRVNTGCFPLKGKVDRQVREAYGDGYWSFIEPLPSGYHSLSFGGVFPDGFVQDINYDLVVEGQCGFDFKMEEMDVVAAAIRKGAKQESFLLGKADREVHSTEVVVNWPAKETILVLSSDNATWWKISRTAGSQIKGIILAGAYDQAVTGVTSNVPIIKLAGPSRSECRKVSLSQVGSKLDDAKSVIQKLTGKKLETLALIPDEQQRLIIGNKAITDSQLVVEDGYKLEDFGIKRGLLTGQKGIDQLMSEGKIRQVTAEDILQWQNAASAKYRDVNPSVRVPIKFPPSLTYVILDDIDIPSGMYGGHSRYFLMPDGIGFPRDSGSHNQYYSLVSGGCLDVKGGMKCR